MMELYTYIILVNWNGWEDTIECLESVLKLEKTNYRVIVCDNDSKNDSIAHIEEWANGSRDAGLSSPSMSQFSTPYIEKPLPYERLTVSEINTNKHQLKFPLTIVNCEGNLGFAGGNNVGLRLALAQNDMEAAWLLNNDTVVDTQSLYELWSKMKKTPSAGIIGSTVRYYNSPNKVQAFAGSRYYPFSGVAMHIGRFKNDYRLVDEAKIEKQLKYIMGASMYVSKAFLETVGLMQEDYFLYYEELDWAERAKGKFKLAYASKSNVYHKAGASIGSSNKVSQRSLFSDTFLMENRVKVTRRFYPHYLMSVKLFLLVEAGLRLVQGRFKQAKMILSVLLK